MHPVGVVLPRPIPVVASQWVGFGVVHSVSVVPFAGRRHGRPLSAQAGIARRDSLIGESRNRDDHDPLQRAPPTAMAALLPKIVSGKTRRAPIV
ncbi:hypothetical protein C27AD_17578 [Salinisphaera hydrothermalis C27AD]